MTGTDSARVTTVTVKAAIQRIGPMFFFDPATMARGGELGYGGMEFYFAGRGGVLGDAADDVVVGGFTYFTAEALLPAWHAARKVGPPEDAAAAFAECCHAWGRNRLTDFPGVERLAELAGRVVRANDLGRQTPLYSGWRALPEPDDAPARAAHYLQTLREHRGDLHAIALRLHRVGVLEAMIGEHKDPNMIAFFGYTKPFPELDDDLKARRTAAEALTDELVAAGYSVLTDEESAEFAALVPDALAYLTA